jgi:hypothetical protein
MRFHVAAAPVHGSTEAERELNVVLGSHRVLGVERHRRRQTSARSGSRSRQPRSPQMRLELLASTEGARFTACGQSSRPHDVPVRSIEGGRAGPGPRGADYAEPACPGRVEVGGAAAGDGAISAHSLRSSEARRRWSSRASHPGG